MRTAAMILASACFGIYITLTLAHAYVLRFNRSEYGWHTITGMATVSVLFLAIRLTYEDWAHADALMTVVLGLALPIAAWRASFLLRPVPPPPPRDDLPSP